MKPGLNRFHNDLAEFLWVNVPIRHTGAYGMTPFETVPRDTLIHQLWKQEGYHLTKASFTRLAKRFGYHARQARRTDGNGFYMAVYRSPDTPVYNPGHEIWTTAVD